MSLRLLFEPVLAAGDTAVLAPGTAAVFAAVFAGPAALRVAEAVAPAPSVVSDLRGFAEPESRAGLRDEPVGNASSPGVNDRVLLEVAIEFPLLVVIARLPAPPRVESTRCLHRCRVRPAKIVPCGTNMAAGLTL
jgi:hypothetical protein